MPIEILTCTKILEWDAAHRILGHESKCKHLHGHRYKAEITVAARSVDPQGRMVDFGVIKELVGVFIDQSWDHNCMLNPADPLLSEITKDGGTSGKTPFTMPKGCENPTAENIAITLFHIAQHLLTERPSDKAPLTVTNVRVWETPSCYADYSVLQHSMEEESEQAEA